MIEASASFRVAVRHFVESIHESIRYNDLTVNDIDWFIPHQANLRISDGLITKLKVPKEKVCRVIHKIGNTSGASVAISLDMTIRGQVDNIKINRGDCVGLTAIAGGYSAGSIVFKY